MKSYSFMHEIYRIVHIMISCWFFFLSQKCNNLSLKTMMFLTLWKYICILTLHVYWTFLKVSSFRFLFTSHQVIFLWPVYHYCSCYCNVREKTIFLTFQNNFELHFFLMHYFYGLFWSLKFFFISVWYD